MSALHTCSGLPVDGVRECNRAAANSIDAWLKSVGANDAMTFAGFVREVADGTVDVALFTQEHAMRAQFLTTVAIGLLQNAITANCECDVCAQLQAALEILDAQHAPVLQ